MVAQCNPSERSGPANPVDETVRVEQFKPERREKMKSEEHQKIGITTIKLRENDFAIFINGRQALVGLSEKDVELFKQKTAGELIDILSMNRHQLLYSPQKDHPDL